MGSEAIALAAVVRSAATGDEMAFARLVAEHHASMARVAYVICGDADTTRDAVQTAWAIAWRRIGSLRDPSRVRAWLIAIAANEARKAAGRRRRLAVVDISPEVAARVESDDPVDWLEVIDLELALAALKPDERALLAMRYAAGLDSNEIGRQLGISGSGVRSRLTRIIDRLRADLVSPMETER